MVLFDYVNTYIEDSKPIHLNQEYKAHFSRGNKPFLIQDGSWNSVTTPSNQPLIPLSPNSQG